MGYGYANARSQGYTIVPGPGVSASEVPRCGVTPESLFAHCHASELHGFPFFGYIFTLNPGSKHIVMSKPTMPRAMTLEEKINERAREDNMFLLIQGRR
eukprot:jgi/Tetstr1/453942/TSEL_040861.t1